MRKLTEGDKLLIYVKSIDFNVSRITKYENRVLGFLGTECQEQYVLEYLSELQYDILKKTPKKTLWQKIRSKFRRYIKRFKS